MKFRECLRWQSQCRRKFWCILAGSSRSLGDVDKKRRLYWLSEQRNFKSRSKDDGTWTNVKASKISAHILIWQVISNESEIMQLIFVIIQSWLKKTYCIFRRRKTDGRNENDLWKMFHNISKVQRMQEWLQKVHDSENFIDQKTSEEFVKVTGTYQQRRM